MNLGEETQNLPIKGGGGGIVQEGCSSTGRADCSVGDTNACEFVVFGFKAKTGDTFGNFVTGVSGTDAFAGAKKWVALIHEWNRVTYSTLEGYLGDEGRLDHSGNVLSSLRWGIGWWSSWL